MARQIDLAEAGNVPTTSGLLRKIAKRTAEVGVVGLGYVGLPTLAACAHSGFKVTGLDVNQGRVDEIMAGRSYIEDVDSAILASLVQDNRVTATTDYAAMSRMDVIVICVPTPINKYKEPELGPLQSTIRSLSEYMQGEQLIALQSTTYPGTTEEMVLPQLEKPGRQVGKEFFLAFSSERIDPGNKQYQLGNIPKVVGGVTPQCGKIAVAFFSTFVESVIQVSSPRVAEMTKLLENIFRSVNIALVNELSELCHRMGIDIWEVIRGATTKPFGFMPFYPSIGVGGHCIPVDPFYLSWKAKEYDFYVNVIDLAAKTNDNRPYYAVSRIVEILAGKGRAVKGARLLLLGVSFKKDIGDTRNSPAMRVAELLAERNAEITYNDRHVPEATIGGSPMKSTGLDDETIKQYDAVIILVDHSYYEFEKIVNNSELVIDTRDATRPFGPRPNVVKL